MIIKDKKIVLTGATGGVGKEIAKKLHRAGANLLLISKSEGKLKNLRDSLMGINESETVKYLAIDFSNLEHVNKSIPEIIKITGNIVDVLINNAGIGYHGKIETIDIKELEETFSVNTLSPIILTSRLLPFISHSSSGHIIVKYPFFRNGFRQDFFVATPQTLRVAF